jgi:hypothetical protein
MPAGGPALVGSPGPDDQPTTGGVTVTVNEPVALLLAASVAEQETVVVPTSKVLPDGGLQSIGSAPSTRSFALATYFTTVGTKESTVILAGRFSVGGVVSCTVTVNDPFVVRLALSVAEQVTVVVPSGKTDPEAGLHVGVRVPS